MVYLYTYKLNNKYFRDLFTKKIESYRDRYELGQSVEAELHEVLSKWLINHIQHDDQDYVDAVRDNMLHYLRAQEQKKGKSWFSRFFN